MSDNNEMREQKFGAGKKELRKAVGVFHFSLQYRKSKIEQFILIEIWHKIF